MANKPSPEELKNGLSEMQFYVTQHHGTETAFHRTAAAQQEKWPVSLPGVRCAAV